MMMMTMMMIHGVDERKLLPLRPNATSFCILPYMTHMMLSWLQVHPVVGAYMEFVERKPLPQHEHLAASGQLQEVHRRDGFEAASAKDIFASTTLAAAAAQK